MTHRNRIALVALVALIAVLPLAALAEPGPGRRGGGPGGPGRHIFPPPGYLDLTDEQIEAVQAIHETVRASLEGAREEGQALREQIEAALEVADPDAAEVGRLAIALHAHRQQMRAVFADVEAQFAALLTAEQLEKWKNFKELRASRRGPRHRERDREGFRGGFGPESYRP